MDKQKQLDKLANIIENCDVCKKNSVGKMVFGEGNPNARIMFVGEAPGKQEAESGRPFIGRSGKLLRSFIKNIQLDEKNVYITSPVKYLPKSGTPTRDAILHARTHFLKQVEIINPGLLILLGKTAIFAILEEDTSILKHHGEFIKKNNKTYFLTLHPAAVLRFPKYLNLVNSDYKKIKFFLSGK